MLKASSNRGVTLIELMIGLAIFGLLFAMALPSFSAWLANSRVRTTAEMLQTGLAQARSEAMRRNLDVEFVMTNELVDLGNVGTVLAEANGMHWLVRYVDPNTKAYALSQWKSGYEGGGRAEGQAARVQVLASAPLIVFRGMGGTKDMLGAATFDFSYPGAGACATPTTKDPIRCLRVQVSVGGHVRMCDPGAKPEDTRAC